MLECSYLHAVHKYVIELHVTEGMANGWLQVTAPQAISARVSGVRLGYSSEFVSSLSCRILPLQGKS